MTQRIEGYIRTNTGTGSRVDKCVKIGKNTLNFLTFDSFRNIAFSLLLSSEPLCLSFRYFSLLNDNKNVFVP